MIGYKHPKWKHPNVDIGITACHLWLGFKMKGIETKIDISDVNGCAVWGSACADPIMGEENLQIEKYEDICRKNCEVMQWDGLFPVSAS